MARSEAYLGAFETDKIQVTITKEYLDQALQYMSHAEVDITPNQWQAIYKAIYNKDLVADFIEECVQVALDEVK